MATTKKVITTDGMIAKSYVPYKTFVSAENDRKLATQFERARDLLASDAAGCANEAFKLIRDLRISAAAVEAGKYVEVAKKLLDMGLPLSAEAFLIATSFQLSTVPLELILEATPSAKFLDFYIEDCKLSKKDFSATLSGKIASITNPAVLEWLIGNAAPDMIVPMSLPLIRKSALNTDEGRIPLLLAKLLKKHKKSNILGGLFEQAESEPGALSELFKAGIYAGEENVPELILLICNKLARADKTDAHGAIINALRFLFNNISDQDFPKRLMFCQVVYSEWIMLEENDANRAKLRSDFDKLFAYLLANPKAAGLSERWPILKLHRTDESDTVQDITYNGALNIAQAFRAADSGRDTVNSFLAAARNLAIFPFDGNGKPVPFNPVYHDDIEGGIDVGEDVIIVLRGWKVRDSVLVQAKVTRPKI